MSNKTEKPNSEIFFKYSVLGYLSSRDGINTKYEEETIKPNETIKDFFMRCQRVSELEFNQYEEEYSKNIKRIRNLANKERIKGFGSRENFLEWYLNQEKKCCYCGIKEKYLEKYFNNTNKQYYRNENDKARQRGLYLEIERIITAPESKNKYIPSNTDLACYVCNNAKSDFISPKDFKLIARGINQFWEEKLEIKIDPFNRNADIWEME